MCNAHAGDIFSIDVGEADEFGLVTETGCTYYVIHRTSQSIVLRIDDKMGDSTVLKVNWSSRIHDADTRGRIAAERASRVVRTPRLLWRQLYNWGSTYVMVTHREFIEGTPAHELWKFMSDAERVELADHVGRAVIRMSQFSSRTFGSIQGGHTRSSSAAQHVNNMVFMSRLLRRVKMDDVHTA